MKYKENMHVLKKYFLLVSVNVFVLIVLLEVSLRFLPSKFTEFPARINYLSDKEVGYFPMPNQNESYYLNCIKNTQIKTNELGMRITPTMPDSALKIGLLGDSFLHGLTVSDSLHIATKISHYTNNKVINGGVCGYGTYQELLLWRKLIKPQKPHVTILFLFLENDIRDNQCELARSEGQVYSPCCEINNDSLQQINKFETRTNSTESFSGWLKKNSYTYRALRTLLKSENRVLSGKDFFSKKSFAYNIYRPGFNKLWDDGWKITEWSLATLKKECEESGSKLLVVNVPGPVQWAYSWKNEISKQIQDNYLPPDFDIDYTNKRLQMIINNNKIELLDLKLDFINYRDRFKLQEPVFGWCCDPHWNPLGHQLAADLVYNHLVKLGWVKGTLRQSTKSPKEILGDKLFNDIYTCQQIIF